MPYVNIEPDDAEVIAACLTKYLPTIRGRKGMRYTSAVRFMNELLRDQRATDYELETYGVCSPREPRSYWIPGESTHIVWDALNIHAYDAGPCPCEDDPEGCIIHRWFYNVDQPHVSLSSVTHDAEGNSLVMVSR